MSQWHGGKGSLRRQAEVPDDVVQDNWDNIFKKNKEEDEKDIDPDNPDED